MAPALFEMKLRDISLSEISLIVKMSEKVVALYGIVFLTPHSRTEAFFLLGSSRHIQQLVLLK